MPQPPLLAEQGKPPKRGSWGATATTQGCSSHVEPDPASSPRGGVPAPKERGHPLQQPQHTGQGIVEATLFSSRHRGLAAAGGFVWLFLFFFPLFMAGSLLCISNSNRVTQVIIQLPLGLAPAQLGHVSDTWHHARREGDKGIDTLCPKGKQMASINSSGHGASQELSGIRQVSRTQTPPCVSLRRKVVSSPCAASLGQCCGVSPLLLPLSGVPNPPGAHTGARGPRNLPAPWDQSSEDTDIKYKTGGFFLWKWEQCSSRVWRQMCREKQSTPGAANASFQLQGILCGRQLRGSWGTHRASSSMVPGSASLEKGPGLGSLHPILLLGFSSASGSPLSPPLAQGPSQHFLQFMTPGLMEVRS